MNGTESRLVVAAVVIKRVCVRLLLALRRCGRRCAAAARGGVAVSPVP